MEYFRKLSCDKYTRESLMTLTIGKPDEKVRSQVQKNWDLIAKPLDGLGKFETIIAQIGAITGTTKLDISRKAVIIMCADNGIVEEGVSQSGQEITVAVAENMAKKQSPVGKMASKIGMDTIPVDIGINRVEAIEGLVPRKIRCGTRNFHKEPAMTEAETICAIFTGMEMVSDCKKKGYQILAAGEMGIGNTTTSSAVGAALLHCPVSEIIGRGAGLSDEGLTRKRQIIEEAVCRYDLKNADVLQILAAVGGLDIAGLTGVCIGGALYHMPIVLDGIISLAAALAAEQLLPGTKEYLIASHMGKEPAIKKIAERLGLQPVIHGELALGEGTGAVMMLSLLDIALSVYQDGNTFENTGIEQYMRF